MRYFYNTTSVITKYILRLLANKITKLYYNSINKTLILFYLYFCIFNIFLLVLNYDC